jgi:hypothetical protein
MTDGTEGKVNGWTTSGPIPASASPRDGTAISPVLGASLRRYAAVPGGVVDKFRKW